MARAASARVTTGATVTVACKMPNGMNLGKIHGEDNPDVILRGSNHRHAVGGFGLTHGIDADAFAKWREGHKWLPAVKNGLIFAHDRPSMAKAQAAEMAEVRSGFEGIDPDKPGEDPRVQDEIAPTEEQTKATSKAQAQAAEDAEEALLTADED